MVRSRFCLEIIEREKLVQNAAEMGRQLMDGLVEIASEEPIISAVRGRGLIVAFDLPDPSQREQFYNGLYKLGVLAIRCGERSIRFRPALDIRKDVVDSALDKIREQCRIMHSAKAAVMAEALASKVVAGKPPTPSAKK
jgi:L-lysine 6-transaminase